MSTRHPAPEVLLAYCRNETGQEVVAQVELHLRECGECCRRVAEIVRSMMESECKK